MPQYPQNNTQISTQSGTQSEAQLERDLIAQLTTLGYERVTIRDESELIANLKCQLEQHNKAVLGDTALSEAEFLNVLNHLNTGDVYYRSKMILRDKYELRRDDGSVAYIEFMNTEHWCRNQYQVTGQISSTGNYLNRYDVTLLINGLPLVQIELKRRGLELKEAYNQTLRYQRHSYDAGYGLFLYVQLFVISNGVNSKYFANNGLKVNDFKQTFYWADKDNNNITDLQDFTYAFLEKC